jgi:predicted ABC-type ATPase
LVANAVEIADTATIYDNSRRAGPRIVAQLTAGTVIGAPTWPAWTPEEISRRWPG